jgi:hypothetical protein
MRSFFLIVFFIQSTIIFAATDTVILKDSLTTDSVSIVNSSNSKAEYLTIQNNFPEITENYGSELISLLALIFGFFMGKIYDHWISKRKVKEEGRLWIETFLQLKEPLSLQVNNISNYLTNNPTKQYKITNSVFQRPLNCLDFNSLNEKSIIPFLQRKHKISYLESIRIAGKIKNAVGIIEETSDLYQESFNKLKENSSLYSEIVQQNMIPFRKHLGNYTDELYHSGNQEKKDLAIIIMELHKKYLNPYDSGVDLFKISDEFFLKILELTYEDRLHSEIKSALGYLTICDQSIKNLIAERVYLRAANENVRKSYKNSLEHIEEIETVLNLNG